MIETRNLWLARRHMNFGHQKFSTGRSWHMIHAPSCINVMYLKSFATSVVPILHSFFFFRFRWSISNWMSVWISCTCNIHMSICFVFNHWFIHRSFVHIITTESVNCSNTIFSLSLSTCYFCCCFHFSFRLFTLFVYWYALGLLSSFLFISLYL